MPRMGAVLYQDLCVLQIFMHNVRVGEVLGKGEGEPGNVASIILSQLQHHTHTHTHTHILSLSLSLSLT